MRRRREEKRKTRRGMEEKTRVTKRVRRARKCSAKQRGRGGLRARGTAGWAHARGIHARKPSQLAHLLPCRPPLPAPAPAPPASPAPSPLLPAALLFGWRVCQRRTTMSARLSTEAVRLCPTHPQHVPRDLSLRDHTFLPSPFLPAYTPRTPFATGARRARAIPRDACASASRHHRSSASDRAASGTARPQRCARLPTTSAEAPGPCNRAPGCSSAGQ
jgi:hypothetical protein